MEETPSTGKTLLDLVNEPLNYLARFEEAIKNSTPIDEELAPSVASLINLLEEAIKYFIRVLKLNLSPLQSQQEVDALEKADFNYLNRHGAQNFFGLEFHTSPYNDDFEGAISHLYVVGVELDQQLKIVAGGIAFNLYPGKGDVVISAVESMKELHGSRLGNLLMFQAILVFLEANKGKKLEELGALPIVLDTEHTNSDEDEDEPDEEDSEALDDEEFKPQDIEKPSASVKNTGLIDFYSKLGFRPKGHINQAEWENSSPEEKINKLKHLGIQEITWELDLSNSHSLETLLKALRRQITLFLKIEEISNLTSGQTPDSKPETLAATKVRDIINSFRNNPARIEEAINICPANAKEAEAIINTTPTQEGKGGKEGKEEDEQEEQEKKIRRVH